MKIFIDGDACPVKDEVIAEALLRQLPVVIVTSIPHYSAKVLPENVQVIYVDSGADAADYRIIQLICKNDLLITQDYGLASLALGKGCSVLHHKGFQYDQNNMDGLLESRYQSAMLRKSGHHTKGPKTFTHEDRQKFIHALQNLLNLISSE